MVTIVGREGRTSNQKNSVGFIQKSVTDGITATAGGTKALAVPLTSSLNRVSVCATNGDSVILPAVSAADIGIEVEVVNDGAAHLQVFGQGLDTIDAIATGTGVVLTSSHRCKYQLISYASGVGAWVSQKTVKST